MQDRFSQCGFPCFLDLCQPEQLEGRSHVLCVAVSGTQSRACMNWKLSNSFQMNKNQTGFLHVFIQKLFLLSLAFLYSSHPYRSPHFPPALWYGGSRCFNPFPSLNQVELTQSSWEKSLLTHCLHIAGVDLLPGGWGMNLAPRENCIWIPALPSFSWIMMDELVNFTETSIYAL